MLSFFPLDVLDEIWDVIESVSEGFLPTPLYHQCNEDIFSVTSEYNLAFLYFYGL